MLLVMLLVTLLNGIVTTRRAENQSSRSDRPSVRRCEPACATSCDGVPLRELPSPLRVITHLSDKSEVDIAAVSGAEVCDFP